MSKHYFNWPKFFAISFCILALSSNSSAQFNFIKNHLNPLTWGTYKGKLKIQVDPEVLARMDALNQQLAGLESSFNRLPVEMRQQLTPLLDQALAGMQNLLDQTEVKMLVVVERTMKELDSTLHTNINRFGEVLQRNINHLDQVVINGLNRAEGIIIAAIDSSKGAANEVLEAFVDRASLTIDQKIEMLDLLYQKRGAEFYSSLQTYTETTMSRGDLILANRIDQVLTGGQKITQAFLDGMHKEIELAKIVGHDLIDHAGFVVDSLMEKWNHSNKATISDAGSMLTNGTIGITKAALLFLLGLGGYKLSMLSAAGQLALSNKAKGMLGAFAALTLLLVCYDAPLRNVLSSSEQIVPNYAQGIEQAERFYADYHQKPQEAINSVDKTIATLQGAIGFAKETGQTPSQTKRLRQHLGMIASVSLK